MMEPWWEQALGGYEGEEVQLVNANPPAALKDRDSQVSFSVKKEALSTRNVPVWCSIRGSHLSASSRQHADYVLVHMSYKNETGVGGFGRHRIGKHGVESIAVRCEEFWLYYVKVSRDATTLPPAVLRAMSAAYSQVEGYDYSDFSGARYLRRRFRVDRQRIAHARVGSGPKEGEFERAAVTAEHHTHYRPEEIWKTAEGYKCSLRAMELVLRGLRSISGVTEAMVSTFMIYTLFARPQVAYLVACSEVIWESRDVGRLIEVLKELATPLKSVHCHEILDLTELFELQSLVNRGVGKVNWAHEKRDRTVVNAVKVDPERVYKEAVEIFQHGVAQGFRYPKMDMKKYVRSRWEWVPTGSVHSQYELDAPYIKKNYRHRTKFVTLNMMSEEKVRLMFARQPEIHAWASVKYEWAKQRAIYGVDLTSSVITNFAMYRCEEVFKHRFPVGEGAEAKRVHKRLTAMLKGNESFCYDFDNFNAQHSTESMYAVLCAYYTCFKERMTLEQQQAMRWVRDSVLRMKVHNSEGAISEEYDAKGTLLSGWRLTTFMNTALNYIYFKIAGVFDVEGVKDSVHNGDDVLVAIRSLKAAVRTHKAMADINARAQASKCNIFSVGEFLRVEHKITKEDGLGAQYLSRASATMAHSRVESQEPTKLTEAIKAMVSRAEEIAARSEKAPEIAHDMLRDACDRLCKIFGVDAEVGMLIAKNHILAGGSIAAPTGSIDTLVEEVVEYDEKEPPVEEKSGTATTRELMPGIVDYAGVLFKQYGEYMSEERMVKKIIAATRRQISVTRKTRLKVTDVRHDKKYGFGRAMFGLYRGIVDIPHIDKARFLSISPIAMLSKSGIKNVAMMIKHVKDVDYALRVLL